MTGASIRFTRTRVPGSLLNWGLDREPFPVRTCVRLRWRAHGEINPGSQQARNPASHQSVAADITTSNVIAAFLPRLRDWRTAIERTPTCALAVRRLSRWGHIGVSNLTGSLSRWSFRTLIKPLQKSLSVLGILFRPSPLVAALHVRNMQQRNDQDHGKSLHNHG